MTKPTTGHEGTAGAGGGAQYTERILQRFLGGETVEGRVRPPVLRSWRRSQDRGLVPERLGFTEPEELDLDTPLVRAARPVFERRRAAIADADVGLILADDQARMVLRYASDRSLLRALDANRAIPGMCYAEDRLGGNAIGSALLERRAFAISGYEHMAACLQPFAAVGAPILDPLSGRAWGVVTICSLARRAHPAMETMAREVAEAVEQRLLEQSSERERSLLEAFMSAGDVPPPKAEEEPAIGRLPRGDRLMLEEKAMELIARGRRAAVEVPLSHGGVAVLRAVPRVEATGLVGVVAQVRIGEGSWRPFADVPLLGTPETVGAPVPPPESGALLHLPATSAPPPRGVPSEGPPAARPSPEAPRAEAGGGSPVNGSAEAARARPALTDPSLFLAGEPGVGQLAVSARRRLRLLFEAAMGIGQTLDAVRTAQELAEVTVPRFADLVTVDLPDAVLRGEEGGDPCAGLRRVAVQGAAGVHVPEQAGEPVDRRLCAEQARCLSGGDPVMWSVPAGNGDGPRSVIAVPLCAHGTVLGLATFTRSSRSLPFDDDDLWLAEELGARTGVCIDNARRFTRERATVLALQRRMLPGSLPEQNAVEAAYRYLPAEEGASGDWFDVIPLSGARVALVVGDVPGRGLHAAATMGRLRTAIGNFSALDLPPEDVLGHLDDLVLRMAREEGGRAGKDGEEPAPDAPSDRGVIGTTCVYAVYDPTTRRCAIASAGHPAPAVVRPSGEVEVPRVPAGPPLGRGGPPFDTAELELPEGSSLVLYTDGLVAGHGDQAAAVERLRRTLGRPAATAEETCACVLDGVPAGPLADDATLLVARTRVAGPDRVVRWDLPPDPAMVPPMRSQVARALAEWGLEELGFSAQLIFSELVTNAIRYGAEPIQARLILDRTLICEVWDAGETSPRPRRAAVTDEGGRGLFLVARLAERWGTRFTRRGKAVWAELSLSGEECAVPGLPDALDLFDDLAAEDEAWHPVP
uniref:SpoIIE family protein phosphatase n=1 Tax=Nonomuraea pusilla TaxID=46177 RepID=UPI0006E3C557|nr:SpoIIE family protein phosphatase [Nonomuraea pusilla]